MFLLNDCNITYPWTSILPESLFLACFIFCCQVEVTDKFQRSYVLPKDVKIILEDRSRKVQLFLYKEMAMMYFLVKVLVPLTAVTFSTRSPSRRVLMIVSGQGPSSPAVASLFASLCCGLGMAGFEKTTASVETRRMTRILFISIDRFLVCVLDAWFKAVCITNCFSFI